MSACACVGRTQQNKRFFLSLHPLHSTYKVSNEQNMDLTTKPISFQLPYVNLTVTAAHQIPTAQQNFYFTPGSLLFTIFFSNFDSNINLFKLLIT